MTSQASHIIAAIFILALHTTIAKSAKMRQQDSSSPVYEVNEQARSDDKPRQTGNLPYGNPLAGNSKQNARLHAQNQQAMFNAERIRQHRAQLQRWAQLSQVDSYMKAYHDSQEDHQLAVEQQQANVQQRKQNPVTAKPVPRRTQRPKIEPLKKGIRVIPEAVRITKTDAVKTEKSRSHRSYGSVEYHQHLQPKMYKTVYVSPAPTYDQGVTIKPNGNVGLTSHKYHDETILYTEAVPSKTQYDYPKQYSQEYQSVPDIEMLNSLLKKNPQEQLSSLNKLVRPGKEEGDKDELNSNIDLYFYLKDPPAQSLVDHYDNSLYSQVQPQVYASAYTPEVKDHTPIVEEVDDVQDPNKDERYQGYGFQTISATEAPEMDPTTTKSNNYYKVEVASQTISAAYKPNEVTHYKDDKPEALQYIQPLKYYLQKELKVQGDNNQRYILHNPKPTGVQHLTEDGSGVSAYGEDSLQYAANYEFGYRVQDHHSGTDFGHHEAKTGENTNGHYHVLLPDGRMQNVQYSAGPEGFHADISYEHLH